MALQPAPAGLGASVPRVALTLLVLATTRACGTSATDAGVDGGGGIGGSAGNRGDDGPACRRLDGAAGDGGSGDGPADGGHAHPESPVPERYADLVNPYGYQDRTLAQLGEPIYRGHCARCHGADGRGAGVDGRDLDPPPSNLHDVNSLHTDPYLYWRIREGGDLGATFCSDMPPFVDTLDDDGIWRVITFVRWRFVDF